MERQKDLVKMKVPELKAEAKRLGLKKYSKLRKQELIDLVSPAQNSNIIGNNQQIPEIKITPPPLEPLEPNLIQIQETASALRGFAKQFKIKSIEIREAYGPTEFMQKSKSEISRLMRENRQTKIKIILNCEMIREDPSGNTEILNVYFHSETIENLEATNESEEFDKFIETIEEKIQNFNKRGSNWRFQKVNSLDVHLIEFKPLGGSSWFPLPKTLVGKKAIINMKNEDN